MLYQRQKLTLISNAVTLEKSISNCKFPVADPGISEWGGGGSPDTGEF